jgi:hypothetical protein
MTKDRGADPNAQTRVARMARVRKITRDIRAQLGTPFHSSDHNDLYGEDGLPVRSGSHFELTDIETASKD